MDSNQLQQLYLFPYFLQTTSTKNQSYKSPQSDTLIEFIKVYIPQPTAIKASHAQLVQFQSKYLHSHICRTQSQFNRTHTLQCILKMDFVKSTENTFQVQLEAICFNHFMQCLYFTMKIIEIPS